VRSYDDKLFEPFSSALDDKSKNKFIVLHLMGSHTSYSKRYPASFDHFVEYDSPKAKHINQYDNSVLYNDYIVDSLLTIIRSYAEKNNDAICNAIYLSDHGEDVYDVNNDAGHYYSGSMPKPNVEIPFVVWLSPKYQQTDSAKVQTILSNTNAPYVSDDLFHSVIDLNDIQCEYYEKQRSLFNAEFNAKRKRILEDGYDYDAK
jgi:heptose-I-phosphate ethanolaminephosphotransferase